MNMLQNLKNHKNACIRLICIIISILIIYLLLKIHIIKEVFYMMIMSYVIAYSLKPFYKKLINTGMKKSLSAFILVFGSISIVLICVVGLIPGIIKESMNIDIGINKISDYLETINKNIKFMKNNKFLYVVADDFYGKINNFLTIGAKKIFNMALNFGSNILSYAIIPIIAYYLLVDAEKMENKIITFFPLESRKIIKKIGRDIDRILGKYIWSQFLLCGIIGVCTFVILIALKIKFPITLSLVNAFFNIIPYFGPVFGAIPAVVIAFLESPKLALYTIISFFILQQIEGNILSPKLTGDSIDMHPLTVVILLIIGGGIFGFIGMILAVPIAVIIKVIYNDFNYYLF